MISNSRSRLLSEGPPAPRRDTGPLVGLICAIAFLAAARSALIPEALAYATPIIAVGLLVGLTVFSAGRLRVDAEVLPVLLLAFLLATATAAAGNIQDFGKAAGIGAMWVITFVLALNLSRASRVRICTILVWLGVAQVAIMALEGVFTVDWVRSTIAATTDSDYVSRPNLILGEWTNRAQGTLGYPIAAGHFQAICFALALFAPGTRARLRLPLALVFVVGALLTGTRTALVAIAAASLLGLWMSRRFTLVARIWATVLGVGAALALDVFLQRASDTNDLSFVHRVGVLLGFSNLLNRPLGVVLFGSGLNSHASVFEEGYLESSVTSALDSAYVMTFVTMGLIGLVALIVLMLSALRKAAREFAPAVATFVIFFFAYDALWWHFISVLFFVLVAFCRAEIVADASREVGARSHRESRNYQQSR